MEVREMGIHEKNSPKTQLIWHSGPVSYIFRKLFSRATFSSVIVCLYLEPFRSYLTSKLTILEKYSKIQHIWPFGGTTGGYRPVIYILRKLFSRATFASEIVCLYLESLKNYKATKLAMLEKYAKMQHVWPYGVASGELPPRGIIFRKLRWS